MLLLVPRPRCAGFVFRVFEFYSTLSSVSSVSVTSDPRFHSGTSLVMSVNMVSSSSLLPFGTPAIAFSVCVRGERMSQIKFKKKINLDTAFARTVIVM